MRTADGPDRTRARSPLRAALALVPVLCALLLAACGARGGTDRLRIDAAASLREVVTELAALHAERTGGPEPLVNLAGSGELARQIAEARKTDVFLSAGRAELDRLAHQGLVIDKTRRELCANALVVVARAPLLDFAPEHLVDADAVAIGHPELVPAGRYAAEWLRAIGLWDDVRGRALRTANVRAALASVERGASELAIVYATDAAVAPDLRVVYRVPVEESPRIVYPGAVLGDARRPEDALAFLELCASAEGRAVFERHGFLPPEGE